MYTLYYNIMCLVVFFVIFIGVFLLKILFYFSIFCNPNARVWFQYSERNTSGLNFVATYRLYLFRGYSQVTSRYPMNSVGFLTDWTYLTILKLVEPVDELFLSTMYTSRLTSILKYNITVILASARLLLSKLHYFFISNFSVLKITSFYFEVLLALLVTIITIAAIIPSICFIYFLELNTPHSIDLTYYYYLKNHNQRYNLLDCSSTLYSNSHIYRYSKILTYGEKMCVLVTASQWFWSYRIDSTDVPFYLLFLDRLDVPTAFTINNSLHNIPTYTNNFLSGTYITTYKKNTLRAGSLEYHSHMLDVGVVNNSSYSPTFNKKPQRLLFVDNPLVLPAETLVTLLITSNDVIHSFSLPQFLVKVDAIPGRITSLKFDTKTHVGVFYGQCSEICGINHAYMPIGICIVPTRFFFNVY